jgi:hypothetical protein
MGKLSVMELEATALPDKTFVRPPFLGQPECQHNRFTALNHYGLGRGCGVNAGVACGLGGGFGTGRGAGVGRGMGVGVWHGQGERVGVGVAVGVNVAVAVAVGVGDGVVPAWTSKDPTSMRALRTRQKTGPRWS